MAGPVAGLLVLVAGLVLAAVAELAAVAGLAAVVGLVEPAVARRGSQTFAFLELLIGFQQDY